MFQVNLYSYSLPFRHPFQGLVSKEGVLLRLTDEDGVVSFGEISPLIGRSKETLADVLVALRTILKEESELTLPSLSFGIETAFLTNLATTKQCRLNESIIPNGCRRLPVNALLYGDYQQCLSLLEEASLLGIRDFKLKVGNGPVSYDSQLVRELSDALPVNGQLRLDANGAWTLDEALDFCQSIRGFPIEYIEDPTSNYLEWDYLYDQTQMRFALDEFRPAATDHDYSELPYIHTVVIKPTLFGGITSCLDFASSVVRTGKNVVFTSTFESDFGCLVIANMASTISPTLTHGVWTSSLFTHGLLKNPMLIEDGFLNLESDWSIDMNYLEKIELDV